MPKFIPFNQEKHATLKINPLPSYTFAAKEQITPLLITEFVSAVHAFPVVFLKQDEKFSPFALLSLTANNNAFVSAQGGAHR